MIDSIQEIQQYFEDLKTYMLAMAIGVFYLVVAVSVVGIVMVVKLNQLLGVQRQIGEQQAQAAIQAYRPSPQNPYPPRPWKP